MTDTEERILHAAMGGLGELDPAALTVQRICRASGVTAPTVYYYFGNKDGLIAAAVERLVSDWLEVMDATVSREGDLDQILGQVLGAWEATITSPERPITVFAWATLLMAGSSQPCREALVRARDRTLSMVSATLAPYVDEALAGLLARAVMDAVLAAALQYELDRDRAGLRARLEGVVTIVRGCAVGAVALVGSG